MTMKTENVDVGQWKNMRILWRVEEDNGVDGRRMMVINVCPFTIHTPCYRIAYHYYTTAYLPHMATPRRTTFSTYALYAGYMIMPAFTLYTLSALACHAMRA